MGLNDRFGTSTGCSGGNLLGAHLACARSLGCPVSFDIVALGEIVLPTQYLNIRRIFRRATFRVRDDVVEMEAGSRPTLLAPPLIALPDFQLHPARYKSIVFHTWWSYCATMIIVRASESELELENFAPCRLFGPTINQLKHAVVDPNARAYFFVDPDSLQRCFPLRVSQRSFGEEPVLCE